MPDDEPLDDARAVGTAAAAAAARVTETVARHVSDVKARERVVLERAEDQQAARRALQQAARNQGGPESVGGPASRLSAQLSPQSAATPRARRLEVYAFKNETDSSKPFTKDQAMRTIDHLPADAKMPADGRGGLRDVEGWKGIDADVDVAIAAKFPQLMTQAELAAVQTPSAPTAAPSVVEQKLDQGYDSTEQRSKRDVLREEAGLPLEHRRVVATADQMNGRNPTLAAAAGKASKTRARPSTPAQEQTRGL